MHHDVVGEQREEARQVAVPRRSMKAFEQLRVLLTARAEARPVHAHVDAEHASDHRSYTKKPVRIRRVSLLMGFAGARNQQYLEFCWTATLRSTATEVIRRSPGKRQSCASIQLN